MHGIGDAVGAAIGALIGLCIIGALIGLYIFIPLGLWKLIEIVIWLWAHVHFSAPPT
jgi:hypothetical protein